MTHYVAYLLLKCYHTDEIGTTPKDLLVPFPPHGPGPTGYRAYFDNNRKKVLKIV